ncbi:MAG TPA: DUF998 domain-containing protein [Gammaproteobacteria bacterium]|nr:DUF998 domain-containing protein [Gammaproteobacteria bacterium]
MDMLSSWMPQAWRWLLGAGVLAPLLMAAAVALAGAKTPGHSHRRAFVGALGTGESPWARRFNALWALAGLLTVLCAGGLWTVLGAPVVVAGMAVLGAGILLAGLFPCDPGCPPRPQSGSGWAHAVGAAATAVGGVAAALALGFWAFGQPGAWGLTLYSLITGGAGLALLFTTLGAIGTGYEGWLQRLFLLVLMSWVGGTAVWLSLHPA